MAEVKGPEVWIAGIHVTVYYDDASGRPTRVVTVNPGTKTGVWYEIRNGNGTDVTRNGSIPAGTTEFAIPTGTARRYDLRTDADGNAVSGPGVVFAVGCDG